MHAGRSPPGGAIRFRLFHSVQDPGGGVWVEREGAVGYVPAWADHIQQEIYTVELPTGLDELVDLALRVDAWLQQRDLRGRRKFRPENPSLDTGDTVSHASVDEPMQVGRARLSREERDRRRMRGLGMD